MKSVSFRICLASPLFIRLIFESFTRRNHLKIIIFMGSVSFLVFKNCASLIFKLNFYGLVYGMYFLKFASRQNAPFHNLKYLIKPSTKLQKQHEQSKNIPRTSSCARDHFLDNPLCNILQSFPTSTRQGRDESRSGEG